MMEYSVEEAVNLIKDELCTAPYIKKDLLGNATFERKVKSFVSAFVAERKTKAECCDRLREILKEAGVSTAGILEVTGLISDGYRNEPLLNK